MTTMSSNHDSSTANTPATTALQADADSQLDEKPPIEEVRPVVQKTKQVSFGEQTTSSVQPVVVDYYDDYQTINTESLPGDTPVRQGREPVRSFSQYLDHLTTNNDQGGGLNMKRSNVSTTKRKISVWSHSTSGMYAMIGLLMIFCCLYIVVQTFTPLGALSKDCPCQQGLQFCVCARETVQALTIAQLICLANSRVAAYMLYPLYIVIFLTMARNLRAYLQFTIISEYIPLTSLHHLHVRAGTWIAIGITWHALFHMIRWGLQGNLAFLIEHQTGITGLISFLATPLIVCPMSITRLQNAISFEIRKRLHYLSWLWAVSICFHAPKQHIGIIIGTAFLIYAIDWFYGVFITTFVVPSARFVRLESSIMIRFKRPKGFTMKGSSGYCYVCVPWVSKYEWHAFSAFKDPVDPGYYCFCIAVAGDWTQILHDRVAEPIYRRLWVYGPFPSPFETASDNDHIISIASGIGITPALSVIHSLGDHRKMHLVWICRDASLVEFVMDYGARFDEDAYSMIFYTGERELVFRQALPQNVFLLQGRPDLETLIPSIIRAANQDVMPDLTNYSVLMVDPNRFSLDLEQNVDENGCVVLNTVEHDFYAETARLLQSYTPDELFNAALRRSHVSGRRVVSLQGLKDLMDSVFTNKFSEDQVNEIFSKIDIDKSGYIDEAEFRKSLGIMEDEVLRHRRQSFVQVIDRAAHVADPVVETGDSVAPVSTQDALNADHWRLMYCGGSGKVVETIAKIAKEHHIPLSLESFQW